jgi:hypothetical protein
MAHRFSYSCSTECGAAVYDAAARWEGSGDFGNRRWKMILGWVECAARRILCQIDNGLQK